MGKVIKFVLPADREPEPPTVLKTEVAIKQISKLFTKEELAEIRQDLAQLNKDEGKK